LSTASEALSYLPMVILGLVAFALVLEKATPGARGPIDVQYYMYILTFLVFDVEAMFLIPFAMRFRELGWGPIVAIAVFVGLILVGYLWEIKKRLLTWRTLE
jgi:NADH:ubiquinone oxidoreductase subunit 3 (subunit A)